MESLPCDWKHCMICGAVKLLGEFYQKRPGQLFSWCRICHGEKQKRLRAAKKAACPIPTGRVCVRCKRRKPFAEFHRKGNRWRSECKECRKQEKAAYTEANRERIHAVDAAYRAARSEELKRRQREWREANPDRYREIHTGWKQRNKDRVNAGTHSRRNRLVENGGHWTAAEWQALKEAQDFRCLMCGQREPDVTLTVDHVVPVSKGGSNDISNLQGLCKPCNSTKHDRILDLRSVD
jgi:5-methylcytosine-specific restriction endonuclease McrA